jgi:hypothetical protein
MFNIDKMIGLRVFFSSCGARISGNIIGGYLDTNPNGKTNIILLVNSDSGYIEEVPTGHCRTKEF